MIQPHVTPRSVKTLAEVRPGSVVRVARVGGDAQSRARLLELGFLPGGLVRVVRRAPFGCPMEVDLAGSRWSVRKEIARLLEISPDE